jgi:hypothetical protein
VSQSQSHITTDSQSASLSWCRTPSAAYDQKLDFSVLNLESYSPVYVGALSDERFQDREPVPSGLYTACFSKGGYSLQRATQRLLQPRMAYTFTEPKPEH